VTIKWAFKAQGVAVVADLKTQDLSVSWWFKNCVRVLDFLNVAVFDFQNFAEFLMKKLIRM
jgi:hypothetical protein